MWCQGCAAREGVFQCVSPVNTGMLKDGQSCTNIRPRGTVESFFCSEDLDCNES